MTGLAGVVVAVGRSGIGAPQNGGDAQGRQNPNRQDDCDEGNHLGPPFLFRNPYLVLLWLQVVH